MHMWASKPQGAIQGPVTRWIAAPNPHSATAAPVLYEQAYGVANINRHKQPRQYGRRGKRRMSRCMCWTLAILAVFCVFLTGVAIVVSLLVTGPGDESTVALQVDATKMSVPYFEETNREKFRYYENSFCSDIRTIIENSYSQVEANVESCELKGIESFRPAVSTAEFNVTGTSFTVFIVLTTGEKRPESALNAIIDLLIQGASDGTYMGYPLPCFSQIDKIYFPGVRDEEIIFRKDYCFNVELTNRSLEHNSKLSVDNRARYLEYQTEYCNDMRQLFRLSDVSDSVQLDHCSLNGTESYIEQGLWPPGTMFVLWIQVRRIDVVTETLLLSRLNQLLSKSLLYNSIDHRSAFRNITSGQIIKCRRPRPPLRTTTPSPTTPTTPTEDCDYIEITVPATEIIGVFITNLDIETGTGYGSGPNSTVVEQKIKEIPYIRDIFEKCEAELNCIHPPEVYIISLGDPIGQGLKFSIKITVVISVKESPSEVAIIVAAKDPKGYTRSVNQVIITVRNCDIVSCETYHGGCPYACSTHECNQLLGEGFSCQCPNDQVLSRGRCEDWTKVFPCFFIRNSCFEITSGEASFNIFPFITPVQDPDNELVLTLDVSVTEPVCLEIHYTFDTTCPEDNWISLENCWGYRYWNATYGIRRRDFVDIPRGAKNLIFRLRSLGPLVGLEFVDVTEGPCRRVRLVGGENEKEGVLEFNQGNTWHPVCMTFDLRAFLPNLCYHLGFEKKWEVAVDADQFGERPPSEMYVSRLRCNSFLDQCSTASIISCRPFLVTRCRNGLQALRCADMAEEPKRAVRIVEGFRSFDGRIEVFNRGTWHSIAYESYHRNFGVNAETTAVCRTLGYDVPFFAFPGTRVPGYRTVPDTSLVEYWEIPPPASFGIQCVCGAKDLTECRLYENNNRFSDILGVFCSFPFEQPPVQVKLQTNQIQLVGSSDSLTAGRLELEVDGMIGTVCYGDIVNNSTVFQVAANVVCRTLGYGDTGVAVISQWGFGTRTGFPPNWLQDLRCTGNEVHINECSCADFAKCSQRCSQKEAVALACGDAIDTVLNQVEARLVDEKQIENGGVLGLVEVRRLDFDTETWSEWGTVCDDGITYQEVGVICNMLGYTGGGEQFLNKYCAVGTGDIHVDNLDCPFNAGYMTQCLASPWGQHNCGHHEDLCIGCTNEPISVRLELDSRSGSFVSSGLVVVRYGGRDGLIARGNTFTDRETAQSLCSITLDVPRAEIDFSFTSFFFHSEGINEYRARLLYDLQCPNDTAKITDCQHAGWGKAAPFPDSTMHLFCFRFAPNSAPRVIDPRSGWGNVIMQVGIENGVICSDSGSFTNTEATRVCRDLGRNYGQTMMGTRVYSISVIEKLDCSRGNPTNTSDCDIELSEDKPFCDADRTAAVLCGDDANTLTEVTTEGDMLMVTLNGLATGSLCMTDSSDTSHPVISQQCPGGGVIVQDKRNPQQPCIGLLENLVCPQPVGDCYLTQIGAGDTISTPARIICGGSDPDSEGDDSTGEGTDDGNGGLSITLTGSGEFINIQVVCDIPHRLTDGVVVTIDDEPSYISAYTGKEGQQVLVIPAHSANGIKVTATPHGNAAIINIDAQRTAEDGQQELFSTDCTFEGDCSTGSFRNVDGTLTTTRIAAVFLDYDLPYETCACVNVSKADRGSLLIVRSTTFSYINNFAVQPYGNNGESSVIHGEPTVGYEEVCTTVKSFDRPVLRRLSRQSVDIFAAPIIGGTITIEDFKLYNGSCGTPTAATGTQKCRANNQFVATSSWCDGLEDCMDGSDEKDCSGVAGYTDFDSAPLDWTDTSVMDVYWERWTGPTLAPGTGPNFACDHPTNPLNFFIFALPELISADIYQDSPRGYLVMQAFRGNPGDQAIYEHSVPASSGEGCLSFQYALIGQDVAHLRVEVEDDSETTEVWRFKGASALATDDPYFKWRLARVNLTDNLQFVRIIAVRGLTRYSDIAIDSLIINFNGACQPRDCLTDLEFQCADGTCIPAQFQFDSFAHCADGSDLFFTPTGSVTNNCLNFEFACDDGKCLPGDSQCNLRRECFPLGEDESGCTAAPVGDCMDAHNLCDRILHCPDGADEESCTNYDVLIGPFCPASQFALATGECVEWHQRCDGFFTAYDFSDEANCTCEENSWRSRCGPYCIDNVFICDGICHCSDDELPSCSTTSDNFLCNDSSLLVPGRRVCNGFPDCTDASDEPAGCDCLPQHWHQCDGRCIPIFRLCDNLQDCRDNSDENNCTGVCSGGICACAASEMPCSDNSQCIPIASRCDGVSDCTDCSDEANCDSYQCNAHYQFPCNDGTCIDATYQNDGTLDCPGGEDEECQATFKRCANGQRCYPKTGDCDNRIDCDDLSDEAWCPCNDFQFRCQNGLCISSSRRCNGVNDCTDLSDEFCCEAQSRACQPFQWRCLVADHGVTGCIPETDVCNRINNCFDLSDELSCLKDYQLPIDQCELETSDRCDGVEQCEASPTNNDESFCFSVNADGIVKVNGLPVCIENWDVSWMRYVCTENRQGWYGAMTERADPSSFGEFVLLPPSGGLPNTTLLANGATTNRGCASDPAIVKVNCPAVNCGYRSTSVGGQWDATNQIILSHTARRGEAPWAVALFYDRRFLCSGTILNQCWISTAGHCVVGQVASKMEIVIGINKVQGTHYKVARLILHPEFQANFVDHGLVQLAECLTFDSYVAPLCLPHPEQQFVREYCETAGSGRPSTFTSAADNLQVAILGVIDDIHCLESRIGFRPNLEICIGSEDGWRSTCNGDSGGPTYCSTKKDPQHFVLAGTTSRGFSICNRVGVQASVTYVVEWMIEQMETYQCTCSEGCDPWSFYSTP